MQNGIDLDNFPLPEVASEALRRRNLQSTSISDGVSRINGHDGGVAFRFFIHPVYNPIKSKAAKYEVFDEHEMIEWLKDRFQHPTEQVRFLPEELLRFDMQGECTGGMFKEAYDRFKNGQTAPGMPLSRWGVLADGEVASLASMGIFSVEQLAAQPRGKIEGRLPTPFVEAFERAIQYMNGREQRLVAEKQGDEILALQRENEEKDRKLSELQEQMKELLAGNKTAAPKGKRGKPANKILKPGIIEEGNEND